MAKEVNRGKYEVNRGKYEVINECKNHGAGTNSSSPCSTVNGISCLVKKNIILVET